MEPLELTILGTSCSAPTVERNLYSAIVSFHGEHLLFDCAEGTQRQMMKAGISYMKINHIFLSHFHADHILGLPGLLATMNMGEREAELNIYGLHGVKEKVNKMLDIAMAKLEFKIKFHELRKGIVLENEKFSVKTFPLKHTSACFGFMFKEKDKEGEFDRKKAEALKIPVGPLYSELAEGKKIKFEGKTFTPEMVMDYSKGRKGRSIAFVLDTEFSERFAGEIEGADVLVHEAVFTEKERKRAKKTRHSTAGDGGKLAKKANVGKLILTHLGSRYRDTNELLEEARKEFQNVEVARDLMKIRV